MGSVKDLKNVIINSNTGLKTGDFFFSDRYSIFDWGEMPDKIQDKGRALALMAAHNFEILNQNGIKNHYIGLVDADGIHKKLNNIDLESFIPDTMRVKVFEIIKPLNKGGIYDYTYFAQNRGKLNKFLIGLEVIYRNYLPKGSSLLKKMKELKKNGRNDELLFELERAGLDSIPKPFSRLPRTIIDFSTKLEPKDRRLSEQEAFLISGLTEEDFLKLKQITIKVNDIITDIAENAGFTHYDGKIEFVFDDELSVCDVLGTFDENRFAYNGINISKEILRKWYKVNQPEFYEACSEYSSSGENWQKRCPVKPILLEKEFKMLVSEMYKAGCNEYIGINVFHVRKLTEVLSDIKKHIKE